MKADIGFAPIQTGHESIMLLLHQSAKKFFFFIALMGFEPTHIMVKALCLNHLTTKPYNQQ